ncbi:glycosyltransferase family 2 protein [Rapidithrix thailandica]|uniref:Glycosyltransferase family 2 protein n=1 Tax=Rapidithrix thailandica TaxID=413964 RepID=A0AAW9SJT4_9BACT
MQHTQAALLSILIPVYNEEKTLGLILEKIADVELFEGIRKEIIVINDGSEDDSKSVVTRFQQKHPSLTVKYLYHTSNQGKGAALHTGLQQARGNYLIIQDADLEYDPREYNLLLQPMVEGFADVVYGSRFIGNRPHRTLYFWHYVGNRFITFLSNLMTDLNLTDIETCYKLFRTEYLQSLQLKEKGFGFEPEITAKISKIKGIRIYEIGISYYGRTYKEGKKITWKDGFWALYCILRYNLFG